MKDATIYTVSSAAVQAALQHALLELGMDAVVAIFVDQNDAFFIHGTGLSPMGRCEFAVALGEGPEGLKGQTAIKQLLTAALTVTEKCIEAGVTNFPDTGALKKSH
jgi:hypothetical protein